MRLYKVTEFSRKQKKLYTDSLSHFLNYFDANQIREYIEEVFFAMFKITGNIFNI